MGIIDCYLTREECEAIREQDGYLNGLEDGIEQGIEQGIDKGMLQGKLETAKAMYRDNIPIDKVSKYTGLTEAEIKQACNMAK